MVSLKGKAGPILKLICHVLRYPHLFLPIWVHLRGWLVGSLVLCLIILTFPNADNTGVRKDLKSPSILQQCWKVGYGQRSWYQRSDFSLWAQTSTKPPNQIFGDYRELSACRELQLLNHNLCLCFCSCVFHPFSCCFFPSKQQCLTRDGMIPEFKDKQIAGDSVTTQPCSATEWIREFICVAVGHIIYPLLSLSIWTFISHQVTKSSRSGNFHLGGQQISSKVHGTGSWGMLHLPELGMRSRWWDTRQAVMTSGPYLCPWPGV